MLKENKIQGVALRFLVASFFIVLFNVNATAQGFMMSSVGNLSNTSNNAASVYFKSNANCIDVQSGIAVFNAVRNSGEFVVNCTITQVFNSLGVKMYPNPARKNSVIKFINTPPLTENFSVTVWTSGGALMSSKKETGYSLFQGVMLDVTNLTSGTYILKIESPQYLEAVKFIKAN